MINRATVYPIEIDKVKALNVKQINKEARQQTSPTTNKSDKLKLRVLYEGRPRLTGERAINETAIRGFPRPAGESEGAGPPGRRRARVIYFFMETIC